jgi:four helix bundle protein
MSPSTTLFGAPRGYRYLEVWQLAMDAVQSIYAVTRAFPRDERYGLTAQLRDAAISIPSNIAEGNERRTDADHLRFVSYARASLAEVETQLEIAWRLGYADESGLAELMTLLDRLGRKLNRFDASIVKQSRS